MEASPLLVKIILVAVVTALAALANWFARRNRRYEPGRMSEPVGSTGAMRTTEIPRQRPSAILKVPFVIFVVIGVVLLVIAVFIQDITATIVTGLLAVAALFLSWYILRCYQNCTLVDAPTMTIMTDWRGRDKRVVHEEITKYYPANRRTAVVRDQRGQKLVINVVWFSTPLLARHLMQLAAEGRFAGSHPGDARRISRDLGNVEYIFKMHFPDHYKAILLQGPGANPAAFQKDPAAPQGAGWAGPAYNAWLQALQAALHG